MAGDVIEAGSLRKRVQIQALPASQAMEPNWNEALYTDWTAQGTVWASIEPLSGRELVYANQVAADATHLVTVRYFQGLAERMRFVYADDRTAQTRYFNISFVKDVEERHIQQQCYCQESR